ncbi:hypothetical protein [Chitinibacter sp. GC72]|uniref:hypothetical protein n=1 Tax=Chitinibacter sp. GC72 TaxID=1526917 RepID=UPI0012FA3946|nr:hypothetical protein [Chitinibacter sp. GC72]
MRKLLFSLLLSISASSFAARTFPNGNLLELEAYQPGQMKLSGKVYTTAPAMQVRGLKNTLLMPGFIAQLPRNSKVWVQAEPNTGYIWRVWVVNELEAQQLAIREKQERELKANQQ